MMFVFARQLTWIGAKLIIYDKFVRGWCLSPKVWNPKYIHNYVGALVCISSYLHHSRHKGELIGSASQHAVQDVFRSSTRMMLLVGECDPQIWVVTESVLDLG